MLSLSVAMYCNRCQQTYADHLSACPRCTGWGNPHHQHSDAQNRTEAEAVAGPDAMIDLGSPVHNLTTPIGPPSGASFVSWTALVNKRKKSRDSEERGQVEILPQSVAEASNPPSVAASPAGLTLLAGFLLGCLVCTLLWLAGPKLFDRQKTSPASVPGEKSTTPPER